MCVSESMLQFVAECVAAPLLQTQCACCLEFSENIREACTCVNESML